MRSVLKKNKKLCDGDHNLLVKEVWQIDYCVCGRQINFGLADSKSIVHLDPEVRERVLTDIKTIESKSLCDTIFYKVEGLPRHFCKLVCSSCGVTNLGILGLGECQPARFMVQIAGLTAL